MRRGLALMLFALGLSAAGAFGQAQPSGLAVEAAWARAKPAAAANGAVYVTIRNRGSAPDRLTGAASPVASAAELHAPHLGGHRPHAPDRGPRDRPRGERDPRAGGHVMLVGLKALLIDGQRFPLTLVFETAGAIAVEVRVRRFPPAPSDHHGGCRAAGTILVSI